MCSIRPARHPTTMDTLLGSFTVTRSLVESCLWFSNTATAATSLPHLVCRLATKQSSLILWISTNFFGTIQLRSLGGVTCSSNTRSLMSNHLVSVCKRQSLAEKLYLSALCRIRHRPLHFLGPCPDTAYYCCRCTISVGSPTFAPHPARLSLSVRTPVRSNS